MYFKVIINLDGRGLLYDPNEPLHLDALLAWTLAPRQGLNVPSRSERPADVRLPLVRQRFGGTWVWRASAIMPDDAGGEDLRFWRKRFRSSRVDITEGSPNLTNGPYRDWNMPMPVFLARRMVAYASGSRKRVKKALKEVKYLGRKRSMGYGKITGMEFERMEEDYSLMRDGVAQRWLPDADGPRLVRPRPPYWHPMGRVQCCEVGDRVM